MARYLLGPRLLIDACFNSTPSGTWLNTVKTAELAMSVIAVSAARETLMEQAATTHQRSQYLATFTQVLSQLENQGALRLPFDAVEAKTWEKWRGFVPLEIEIRGQIYEVGQDTRMIVATADAHGLDLVEPDERYHDTLRNNGLMVISL